MALPRIVTRPAPALGLVAASLAAGCGGSSESASTGAASDAASAPPAATQTGAAPAETTAGAGAETTAGSTGAGTSRTRVIIDDFTYQPKTIRVARGATVAWDNRDAANHTVTFDDEDLGNLSEGGRASRTFEKAGSFSYVCRYHPFMKGRVVVRQAP